MLLPPKAFVDTGGEQNPAQIDCRLTHIFFVYTPFYLALVLNDNKGIHLNP